MTLEELAGQVLMIGVQGDTVTPDMVRLFRDTRAGGLILFRPNFHSAQGLKKMLSGLEQALGRRLLVAVDHEGGRVIHLAEGVTVFPDNMALGVTGNEAYAAEQGRIEALELRRLGIDLNLSPTVDVLTETFSPNIGIRSYSTDKNLVARLGAARIKAMQAGGLSACAKHFPGQGHSPLDAHLKLPVLGATWEEMHFVHIKPFMAAIQAGVHTVMSSHPVYANLEPDHSSPATFSKTIIHDFLRVELGFEGVILSDDLEMGALKDLCPIGEAACRAMRAGHDMVLVCHNEHAVREAAQALVEACRNRNLDAAALEKSARRIEDLKAKRKQRFEGGEPCPDPKGRDLARAVAKEAIRLSAYHAPDIGPAPREALKPVVIFPRLSELSRLIFVEPEMLDEESFIKNLFQSLPINPEVKVVGLDPSEDEIESALALAKSGPVVFFCYDAHLSAPTGKLLKKLQEICPRLAVILLRNPYDEDRVGEKTVCIKAYGFRAVQIQAAVECLRAGCSGGGWPLGLPALPG